MSEILNRLANSSDPIDQDLASVLRHWQDVKQMTGGRRHLGYEPRDIADLGSKEVISRRVLKGSAGFEEVDPQQSYEAIVLRHTQEFDPKVVAAARERINEGGLKARDFQAQDIKFLIKTSSQELFGEQGVAESEDAWKGRIAELPKFMEEHRFADGWLSEGCRSLVWFHEHTRDKEQGRGLTAIAEFGPMGPDRRAEVAGVFVFPHRLGEELLEKHSDHDEQIGRMRGFRHTRMWPVRQETITILLREMQKKSLLIDRLNSKLDAEEGADAVELVDEKVSLRSVVERQFQAAFRSNLLAQRPNCCAITGTEDTLALEAAHIIPYSSRHPRRNDPENGLLLRRDIHKLFDRGLISIHPETREVHVSRQLKSKEYRDLHGMKVGDPVSTSSLKFHFDLFMD